MPPGAGSTRSFIVIGLGLGDEGKALIGGTLMCAGSVVDYLVRHTAATLVVRFNGGPQAAHHVVLPDGKWHCFSQFGSGTLVPGVRTLLGHTSFVNILNLGNENQVLTENMGIKDGMQRFFVDKRTPIVSPFHKLFGRLLEMGRGSDSHSSTGVGVGVAARSHRDREPSLIMEHLLSDETSQLFHRIQNHVQFWTIRVGEILSEYSDRKHLRKKATCCAKCNSLADLRCVRCHMAYYCSKQCQLLDWQRHKPLCGKEYAASSFHGKWLPLSFEYDPSWYSKMQYMASQFLEQYTPSKLHHTYVDFGIRFGDQIVDENELLRAAFAAGDTVIFEGAQGALLDFQYGFLPYVSATSCRFEVAEGMILATGRNCHVIRVGVLRTYSHRHGKGPLLTEEKEASFICRYLEPHNVEFQWQGSFRVGHLDLVSLKHGMNICGVPDFLFLTHVDKLPIDSFPLVCTCYRYTFDKDSRKRRAAANCFVSISEQDPNLFHLQRPQELTQLERATFTDLLKDCKPFYDSSWFDPGGITSVNEIVRSSSLQTFILKLEKFMGVRVGGISYGPTHEQKTELSGLFAKRSD